MVIHNSGKARRATEKIKRGYRRIDRGGLTYDDARLLNKAPDKR